MRDNDMHVERREVLNLTSDQINIIAERAAERTIEKLADRIDVEIGRSLRRKAVWIMGAIGIGTYMWLQSHGFIKT